MKKMYQTIAAAGLLIMSLNYSAGNTFLNNEMYGEDTVSLICPETAELKSCDGSLSLVISLHMLEELTEFSVVKNNDQVQIKWITGRVHEHSNFEIEKSKDGKKFKKFADVACVPDGDAYAEYLETDYNPATFYRIKQKSSVDGEYKYSDVVYVKLEQGKCQKGVETVCPAKAQITDYQNKEVLIVVRDKDGNEYTSKVFVSVENGQIKGVDENNMIPAGHYLVTASKIAAIDKQYITITN